MKSDIRVSIICCAYNQENYIEDALKGFISQKTDFGFEVLISDDASTDRTPEIIRKYEEQYPDLIKPLFLKENQYSKGIYPGQLLVKYAKGDYIALCEGDDYWISDNKLQRQFDTMEQHPECDMSAHGALKVRPKDCSTMGKIEPMDHDGILTMEDVINGGGDFIATNSLFFRRSIVDHPTSYLKFAGNDYAYQMCGATRGGIVYLQEIMSAYRRGADNSWTVMMMNANKEVVCKHFDNMIKMLDMVNEETDGKYKETILNAQLKYEFQKASALGDTRAVYSKKFALLRKQMNFKKKLILLLKCIAPWSIHFYQRTKNLKRSKK